MRQSNGDKRRSKQRRRRPETAPFHFIINILFKLRCYCCQKKKRANCNFHKERLSGFQGLFGNRLFRRIQSSDLQKIQTTRCLNEKPVSMEIHFRFSHSQSRLVKSFALGKEIRVIKVNAFKSAITILVFSFVFTSHQMFEHINS